MSQSKPTPKIKSSKTSRKTAAGATILKSSIELNNIEFKRSCPDLHIEPSREKDQPTRFKSMGENQTVFKISKLRIEMETTDMVSVQAIGAILKFIENGGF